MIKMMLIAGAGGFIGTCVRFLICRWTSSLYAGSFPLGTFLVNITGCFFIGMLFGLFEKTHLFTAGENAMLITGFCGGFTTFSTFANDVWTLGNKGDLTAAIVYLAASVIAGVLLVCAGRAIVR